MIKIKVHQCFKITLLSSKLYSTDFHVEKLKNEKILLWNTKKRRWKASEKKDGKVSARKDVVGQGLRKLYSVSSEAPLSTEYNSLFTHSI